VLTGVITSGIVGCLGVWIQRCARRRCWRVSPSPVPTSVDTDNNNTAAENQGDLLSLGNPMSPTQTITSTPEQLALPSTNATIALPALPSTNATIALPAPQPVLAITNGSGSVPPPPPLPATPPSQNVPVGLLYEIQGEIWIFL
jgi:hypothetical protein